MFGNALRSSQLALASAGLLGLLCLPALPMQAQTVYSNDFSAGAGSEWSDNTTAVSNGESFLGTSMYGFGPGTDTLTLTGLAPHSAVTLNFDLYIIQSWDGSAPGAQNGGGSGDFWSLSANGNTLLNTSFANYTNGNLQEFQSQANPDVPGQAPRTGEFDAGHLGFGTTDYGDATYRFSYTFNDTAPTLVVNFTGMENQGPGDEGWGLDNVSVILTPAAPNVPEPGSVALLVGMSLSGAGFLARRRKNARRVA